MKRWQELLTRWWVSRALYSLLTQALISPDTRRWPNAGLMLGQRRRRWANINTVLAQRLVFAGIISPVALDSHMWGGHVLLDNHFVLSLLSGDEFKAERDKVLSIGWFMPSNLWLFQIRSEAPENDKTWFLNRLAVLIIFRISHWWWQWRQSVTDSVTDKQTTVTIISCNDKDIWTGLIWSTNQPAYKPL